MAKKTRTKTKDDDKPAKAGGNKPVKVVTFDTPKSDPQEQQYTADWAALAHDAVDNEPANSGSATWGETADGASWNSPSSGWPEPPTTGWTSPTPGTITIHPPPSSDARPPQQTSPPPHPPSAVLEASAPTKHGQKPMLEETHGYHNWGSHHATTANHEQWGSPLSNATTTHFISPIAEQHSLPNEPQSFTAAATAAAGMRNPQYTSASEVAKKHARTQAPTPQPPPQPAPVPPVPPPPVSSGPSAQSFPQMPPQQWATWSRGTPASPPSVNRFGNRDDFAVVAAALDKNIKKAAVAAGHYKPKAHEVNHDTEWGPQPAEWGDAPKGGGWSHQAKKSSTARHQHSGAEAWDAPKGSDTGWDSRSKRRSNAGGNGWGNGSEAGWSQNGRSGHHHAQEHRHHAQSSKHHQPAKSWEKWGRQQGESESESEDDEDEDEDEWDDIEDLYADRPSKGDGRAGKAGGSGWEKDSSGWNTSGGGDGWAMTSGGWDQPQNDQGWGASQGTWGESKVITDPPENAGSRNVLSPQQRSQILNSLLNPAQGQQTQNNMQYPNGVTLTDNPVPGRSHKPESSWGQHDAWGHDSGWGPIPEEGEEESGVKEHRQSRPTQQSHDPWSNSIDNTSYSMPSKTLAHAYKDTKTSLHQGKPRNSMQDYTPVQFVESDCAALQPVSQALFGKARWAKDRIHWMFPPDKDERVSMLLGWIESMSYELGTFGLHKFLQSRERGALITNADFRAPQFPGQPVFDWLTFDQLQGTMDKIMQESVVFYDPATQVIVFVLLPSKSGNSVAMWRRKIKVPNNTRLMYQPHIAQAMAGLKRERDYTVYVDRLPLKPEDPDKPKPTETSKVLPKTPAKIKKDAPASIKKKRKWWQIFK